MRFYTIVFFLLVAFATSAQKPIKITTEVDAFTGDTSISTSIIEFRDFATYQGGLVFVLHSLPSGYYIETLIGTDHLVSIEAGQAMIIKMADGTIITLACIKYAIADYKTSSSYWISAFYGLPADDLDKLASVAIEKIRFETTEANIDKDPSPKKAPENCRLAFAEFIHVLK